MLKNITLTILSKAGNNIKKFRKKRGLTQDGLARKADIPCTTLTNVI